MAITASQVTTSQTLEEFRLEYNKLQADVLIIKDNPTFSSSLVFEGETADAFETTFSVTDPTADRTIVLPDASGTLLITGGSGFEVADGGSVTLRRVHLAHGGLVRSGGCARVSSGATSR